MPKTPDEFDLFDEVEDSVIPSSLQGPSTIENFSSQMISRLGITSHHVQRAETANFTNNSDMDEACSLILYCLQAQADKCIKTNLITPLRPIFKKKVSASSKCDFLCNRLSHNTP